MRRHGDVNFSHGKLFSTTPAYEYDDTILDGRVSPSVRRSLNNNARVHLHRKFPNYAQEIPAQPRHFRYAWALACYTVEYSVIRNTKHFFYLNNFSTILKLILLNKRLQT